MRRPIGDDFKVSHRERAGRRARTRSRRSPGWLLPAHIADDAKRSAIAGFLKWMLGPGQTQAAALGYLALPKDLVAKEQDAIARLQ